MAGNEPQAGEMFGQRIKRRRRELGLTQREVAAKLKIDFTYLSKLENNPTDFAGDDTVRGLALILGEDEEELFALAGKVPPELRIRAQHDVAFARLVRRLPDMSAKDLDEVSRQLKIAPPKP